MSACFSLVSKKKNNCAIKTFLNKKEKSDRQTDSVCVTLVLSSWSFMCVVFSCCCCCCVSLCYLLEVTPPSLFLNFYFGFGSFKIRITLSGWSAWIGSCRQRDKTSRTLLVKRNDVDDALVSRVRTCWLADHVAFQQIFSLFFVCWVEKQSSHHIFYWFVSFDCCCVLINRRVDRG